MGKMITLLTYIAFKGANLCCPGGHEGLDPLQVHLDDFCISDLLDSTQLKNHLQQMVSPRGKYTDSTEAGNVIHSQDSALKSIITLFKRDIQCLAGDADIFCLKKY